MDNEYLKHPKHQRFYQVLAFISYLIGLNTQYWQWFSKPTHILCHIQRAMVLTFGPISLISQIMYLLLNYKEHAFSTLATMFAIIPITTVIILKIVLAQTPAYKTAMTDFMDKIHLYNYCHTFDTQFVRKAILIAEKQFRTTLYVYMSLCYTSFCSWQIIPIINNLNNNPDLKNITNRLESCTHIWLPFDYEFDFFMWSCVQVIMVYVGFIGITILFCFDSFNLAFVYHLTGHINIMKHLLRSGFCKEMTQTEIRDKLVELTKYYQFIRETFKNVETAFGVNVAGIYGLNLLMGGILLYQFTASGADTGIWMTYGLMIPIYMGILLVMSYVLEKVRMQADNIPELVYDLRWEAMSVSNAKLLMLLLNQVQPILEFRAAFNLKTGVQPALNIIKTTFSYYIMIKSRI